MRDTMFMCPGTFNGEECFKYIAIQSLENYSCVFAKYFTFLKQKFFERPRFNLSSITMDYELNSVKKDITERLNAEENLILVGHSKGALYLAYVLSKLKNPNKIKALIMLAPAPPKGISAVSLKSLWLFKSTLGYAFTSIFSKFGVKRSYRDTVYGVLDPEWPEEIKREIWKNLYWEPVKVLLKLAFNPPKVDLSGIDCPKLVIAGKKDVLIPPKLTKKIADHYGAEYRKVDSPHYLLKNEETFEIIDEFLKKINNLKAAAKAAD